MALQGSGSISLSQIQTEFGGTNPASLSEYYRGGSYTTSNNTGVPTSGSISISQFYGTTAFVPDYVPNSVNWANISWSTTSNSGSGSNSSQTISGINQTITLRATISSYSGNIESGTFSVYRNSSYVGGITSANGSYDFTVSSGDTIYFAVGGETSAGTKSNSFTVSVYNQSDSSTLLDTFTVSGTVDSDNNYNIADYIPSAVNWTNISEQSNFTTSVGGQTNSQTISGINQTITLEISSANWYIDITNDDFEYPTSGSVSLYVNKNGSFHSEFTLYKYQNGIVDGSTSATVSVSSGDTITFEAYGSMEGEGGYGHLTGGGTVSVKNTSSGNTELDTFTVALQCDSAFG